MTTSLRPLRQGLPRVPGGDPWPPPGFVEVEERPDFLAETAPAIGVVSPVAQPPAARAEAQPSTSPPANEPAAAAAMAGAPDPQTAEQRVPLRRGLPRVAGGEPWPPAGFGLLAVPVIQEKPAVPVVQEVPDAPAIIDEQPEVGVQVAPAKTGPSAARTTPRPAPRPASGAAAAPQPFNLAGLLAKVAQAVRFPAVALVGAIAVVGGTFMLVRWLLGTDAMAEFLVRYPGEYPLPEGAAPGFPAWVRWSHFLNMFFIILIIRSGLQSRYEKKPPAYWTPRWSGFGGGKKISISLWLHQLLDILWLLNGVVFVTLLFVTGHWMRIVPTSWTVFPNALSAMLQYLSLDWPTENGWMAYNSLQQLAYFTVVFIAAPLAAVTGLRLSGLWPSKAKRLSTAYPLELARAVHFPTMLFFVFFVITHVAMVFATGALRNLNHMFSGTDATNWTGFWIFVAALTVIAVLWELARPVILAPIASLLGQVSQR